MKKGKRLLVLGVLGVLVVMMFTGCAGGRWTKTVRYVFVDPQGAAVEHEWSVETRDRPADWMQLFSVQQRVEHRDTQTTRVIP